MADGVVECIQRAFEPRMEEEIKGLLYGEILGQEIFYNQFDNELTERLLQLGMCPVALTVTAVTL